MHSRRQALSGVSLGLLAACVTPSRGAPLDVFNIRSYGARGDGVTLDTAAIQKAIDAASEAGGGTVFLPHGRYLSFTLRLRSHITILFESGAVLLAADPAIHKGHYDFPEENRFDQHQDFGHNYWHNSLMWGDGLEDVTFTGPGLIDGAGLTRESPTAPWSVGIGRNLPPDPKREAAIADFHKQVAAMRGQGNKAIALKNSKNIIVRDLSFLRAGHFGLLLTGVDNITLDNLKIDTQRDGMDLDVVRNARVSNCTVNSPYDDGIVLKSSYALGGTPRPTENVSITNCQVSGYDVGSLLDGTYRKLQIHPLMNHRTSGRIKLGTESNGGFRNIAVSNCVFDCCNGLAIESVDGGVLEDVTVSNLVMRDATAAPLFIRLADRRRAPDGTPIAQLRRVSISDIDCVSVDPRLCSSITGVPGATVEDVTVRGMRWTHQGGASAEYGNRVVPEQVEMYPDPDMFGGMPAWGLYARHVRGLVLEDIEMTALQPDGRKAVIFDDVSGVHARDVLARNGTGELQPVTL